MTGCGGRPDPPTPEAALGPMPTGFILSAHCNPQHEWMQELGFPLGNWWLKQQPLRGHLYGQRSLLRGWEQECEGLPAGQQGPDQVLQQPPLIQVTSALFVYITCWLCKICSWLLAQQPTDPFALGLGLWPSRQHWRPHKGNFLTILSLIVHSSYIANFVPSFHLMPSPRSLTCAVWGFFCNVVLGRLSWLLYCVKIYLNWLVTQLFFRWQTWAMTPWKQCTTRNMR